LTGALPLDESGETATRRIPRFDNEPHVAGSVSRTQPCEQLFEGGTRAFGDDEDSPVGMVGGVTDQPEFEGTGAGEPAESDALDPAVHPGGQARGVGRMFVCHRCYASGVIVSDTFVPVFRVRPTVQ